MLAAGNEIVRHPMKFLKACVLIEGQGGLLATIFAEPLPNVELVTHADKFTLAGFTMTAMALLLMLALWLIALATALLFSLRWLPPLAALNSGGMDTQIKLSFAVLGVLFLGTQAALAWFVFRFRQSRQSIPPQRQAVRDALWMTLAAGIFFMLTVLGAQVWAQTSYLGVAPDADAVRVEVTAEQFRWYFRYPGADGKFGATNIRLQDASEGNPLGLDP